MCETLLRHRAFAGLTRAKGCPAIEYTGEPDGCACLTVGSGLMMLTADQLLRVGVNVCCTVDFGRLADRDKAMLVSYASYAHECVVVHTWHSRSLASDFVAALSAVEIDPASRVYFRIRGIGEQFIPREFPNLVHMDQLLDAVAG